MAGKTYLTKNQLEAMRIHSSETRFVTKIDLVKSILTGLIALFGVWIIMTGLANMSTQEASSLSALSSVIKELRVTEIITTLAGGGIFVAYSYERAGKKRAIRKLGELRKQLESTDEYRGGSGLTNTGGTP